MKKNKKKSYNDTVRTPVVIGVLLLSAALVVGLVIYTQQPTPPLDARAGQNEEQEQEPNDATTSATIVRDLGQKHRGKISSKDTDFWKVVLTPERRYQLQMVKDDNDKGGGTQGSKTNIGNANRSEVTVLEDGSIKQNTGNDQKDEIRWALASSSGTLVVENKKKNFTYTVPDGSDRVFYVKISSHNSGELHYKFVLKDITNKEQ